MRNRKKDSRKQRGERHPATTSDCDSTFSCCSHLLLQYYALQCQRLVGFGDLLVILTWNNTTMSTKYKRAWHVDLARPKQKLALMPKKVEII